MPELFDFDEHLDKVARLRRGGVVGGPALVCDHKGAKDISSFDDRAEGVQVINCARCGVVEIECSPS